MIDICDENIIAMYHFTDDDRVMGSIDGAKKLTQTVKNSQYTTKDNEEIGRIHVSLLTSNGKAIDENSYAIDSSIKHIGFCITYGMNAENPHQEKFESGKTVFLYTEEKQQKNEIDDFTKFFEDYTDEISVHFLRSKDFESFDTLVKALKPLDEFMEDRSETQESD